MDNQYKDILLEFKTKFENIPNELCDWTFLDNTETWLSIRKEAN